MRRFHPRFMGSANVRGTCIVTMNLHFHRGCAIWSLVIGAFLGFGAWIWSFPQGGSWGEGKGDGLLVVRVSFKFQISTFGFCPQYTYSCALESASETAMIHTDLWQLRFPS